MQEYTDKYARVMEGMFSKVPEVDRYFQIVGFPSITQTIGFVGLVVPHLLRPVVGHHPSRLLLPSALAGAAVLLAADILVRVPMRGPELKLGVVTALIGAPFFLHLILKTRRSGE